jgi:hypothetical protein
MQRILMELIGAMKEVIKHPLLLVDVTLQQCLGEIALVRKMIEKTTFGNAHSSNDFLNRRRSKPLGQNSFFSHFQYPFTFAAASIQNH